MDDYRRSLRTVGAALIILGLLDVGVMIYCIATRTSYSSSFNLFAVIAGVYLRRGNLRAARWVAFFSAFYLSGFASIPVILALLMPASLILTVVRLHPVLAVVWLVVVAGLLALLAWVYQRLTSADVLTGMDSESIEYRSFRRRPSMGFVIGGALGAVLLIAIGFTLRGNGAERAKAEARRRMGPSYQYFVSKMSTDSSGTRATVIAYSPREAREVEVRWENADDRR